MTDIERVNANRPFNPVFFVARSHRDLSSYLLVNTLKRAANDQDLSRRASSAHEESNVLYFVNSPVE
jgi:hypothetical protein